MPKTKTVKDYEHEIFEKAITCLRNVKNLFLTTPKQPSNFYQYSTISAFKGIIESNNLWATHWAYMNDSKELQRGLEIAKQVILKFNQTTKPSHLSSLERYISNGINDVAFDIVNAYVLCFSEESDNLNLWRGYGDGYNSIVIDYSTTHLELNKNTLGKPLIGKVVYDEREQKKIILTYLKQYNEMMTKMHKKLSRLKENMDERILGPFIAGLIILSLFMKEKCWNEEKEWRIIYFNPDNNFLDFRETDKGLIPYVKVPIFKKHALTCIKNICLPKSPNYALREKSIKMLWNKTCNENKIKKNLKVKESSISIVY